MWSGKYCSHGNRQTQTHPSGCQIEKRDLLLQRTHLHCSGVLWQRALQHCIQSFVLHLVMSLAIDRRIFSSKEISWMDLLHRWQPFKVPHLKSLSS
ncbi:unnamed protein product [Staurois parvus]|uniref:Uncharacterized protein n=1 Tax=Staurois parvus TaxID=386267 RepID=A0ABN9H9U4_9NEOB|nr:unnamed protein product [Staurois parvus]